MINDGAAITFESVAAKAGVSRSWLYSAADLRVQIAELRADTTSSIKRPTKLSQRATDMSLLTRLEVTQERLRQVIAENTHLRAQLELALGVNRAGRQGLKSTTEIRN